MEGLQFAGRGTLEYEVACRSQQTTIPRALVLHTPALAPRCRISGAEIALERGHVQLVVHADRLTLERGIVQVGLAVAINTTLSAIAPKVAGRLYDHGVGYGGTFYFLAGWCFLGAVVLFLLRPPPPRQKLALR